MGGLIVEGLKLLGSLLTRTPKNMRKVRNVATVVGAGTGAVLTATQAPDAIPGITPEMVAMLPEPYTAIISGALMVVSGIIALIAQSKTIEKETEKP
jgi:hypothetical protein